jgi:predicted ATP-dependent serine protease
VPSDPSTDREVLGRLPHHPFPPSHLRQVWWDDIKLPENGSSSLRFLGQDGVIHHGESHLIASTPKTGKTTLLLHLVREWQEAYAEGCPSVLWFSEEGEDIWARRKAHVAWQGLPLVVVTALGERPSDLVMRACDGWEDVVVVDTCTTLMGIEDQNNPSMVSKALSAWIRPITSAKKTLIFVHHRRKSDGDFGSAVAGSYMWSGMVDTVLEVREDPDRKNRRVVVPRARVEVPSRIVYELRGGRLWALGTADEVSVYGAGQVPPWDAAVTQRSGERVPPAPPS